MADDALLQTLFNGQSPTPMSYQDAVYVPLQAGRAYTLNEPLKITGGTAGDTFRVIVEGRGARFVYAGGKGNGPAFQLGDKAANKKALHCTFRDMDFTCTRDGSDELLRLDYGNFCRFDGVTVRGAGVGTVGTGLQINNQQSLSLDQFCVSYCDIGVKCGTLANVLNWQSGKVYECKLGAFIDSSTGEMNCVDFSKCINAIEFSKCSQWKVHVYTEQITGTVFIVRDSLHIDFSGLVNGLGVNGFEIINSKSIDIGNIESRMLLANLVKCQDASTFRISPFALPMKP